MDRRNPVSDQQEGMEQMAARFRGEKGAKGDKGDSGPSRLPAIVAWSLVILFVVAVAIGGTAWFAAASAKNAATQAVHREQAAQRKAGALVEKALCADVATMAAIPPPAGNAAAYPSRAYEQAEHRAWLGLVAAIGCKGTS
jgi:hypothetical protein